MELTNSERLQPLRPEGIEAFSLGVVVVTPAG